MLTKYTSILQVVIATICCSCSSYGQIYFDTARSVKTYATITESEDLAIRWLVDPEAEKHTLWKKPHLAVSWDSIGLFATNVAVYVDTNALSNVLLEYRVVKDAGPIDGYGYVLSGIQLDPIHHMGRLLILIETQTYTECLQAVEQLEAVLRSEGWTVSIKTVDRSATAAEAKSKILQTAAEHPQLRALLILGDVPVPHSGDINPDAHLNHKGAWAADLYYGDLDGIWTDTLVNNSSSDNPRNHNVPGDGRWDQSIIPSDIELEVGRVDFSELPAFAEDEYELLRRYLEKDIAYRTKQFRPEQRAAIKQTNQWNGGLGQNAFRNFSPLVGPDSIMADVFDQGFQQSYLWFYGGGSGSYTSATFMGNTNKFATDSLQFVFTSFFGSYYGDYDYENNYLRAALGSGTVLSSAWVGAPHWAYHPMGMGYTLGYCAKLTQNNMDTYSSGLFPRGVHVNLLGDPTLKSYIVAPPADLLATQDPLGVALSWSPSSEAERYHMYRKPAVSDGAFIHIGTHTTNSYTDPCVPQGTYEYLVRAEKLETTPSGSFYNLSSGPTTLMTATGHYPVTADFTLAEQDGVYSTTNNSVGATSYTWILPSGGVILADDITFSSTTDSVNYITLIASNGCQSDTLTKVVFISSIGGETALQASIYPNPTTGELVILPTNGYQVQIYSPAGILIQDLMLIEEQSQHLDLSNLTNGVYIIKLVDHHGNYLHQRVIKL